MPRRITDLAMKIKALEVRINGITGNLEEKYVSSLGPTKDETLAYSDLRQKEYEAMVQELDQLNGDTRRLKGLVKIRRRYRRSLTQTSQGSHYVENYISQHFRAYVRRRHA